MQHGVGVVVVVVAPNIKAFFTPLETLNKTNYLISLVVAFIVRNTIRVVCILDFTHNVSRLIECFKTMPDITLRIFMDSENSFKFQSPVAYTTPIGALLIALFLLLVLYLHSPTHTRAVINVT